VSLEIFNMAGKKMSSLINSNLSAGEHELHFSADGLPSGVYFYRLTAGSENRVEKMTILR